MKLKKVFKNLVHILYLTQLIYSLLFFLSSSKDTAMMERRLRAWEVWITVTLYGMFLWLITSTEEKEGEDLLEKLLSKNKVLFAYAGLILSELFILILTIIVK